MSAPARPVARADGWRRAAVAVATVLLAGALAAVMVACGTSDSEDAGSVGSSVSTSPSPTSLGTDGAQIFATKCAGCHGSSGEGNLGPALVGIADRMSVADQIAIVSNGRGTMLAFAPALTPEQIAAVVSYTRTGLP